MDTGQPGSARQTPHAGKREAPTISSPKPSAPRATPTTSILTFLSETLGSGKASVPTSKRANIPASTMKDGRSPTVSSMTPKGMGESVANPAAAAIAPKAVRRLPPEKYSGTMPKTDGTIRLAPNPTRPRPPHMNRPMSVVVTSTISPASAKPMPSLKFLRHPTTTPKSPPKIINAPATSEYTMVAICTSS